MDQQSGMQEQRYGILAPLVIRFLLLCGIYAYVGREIGAWRDRDYLLLFLFVSCSSHAFLLLSLLYSFRNRIVKHAMVAASSLFLYANILNYRYFNEPLHFGSLYAVKQLPFVTSYALSLVETRDLLFLLCVLFLLFSVSSSMVRLKRRTLLALFSLFLLFTGLRFSMGILPFYLTVGNLEIAVKNTLLNPWDRLSAVNRFGFLPNLAFEAYQLTTPVTSFPPDPPVVLRPAQAGPRPDIFLIQVESLPLEIIGRKYAGIEATPFLNTLAGQSLSFSNIHPQHTAGGGTSDVDFAVLTSRRPSGIMPPFYASGLGGLSTLPRVLKASGYSTFAYHAHKGGFWGRKKGFYELGFDRFISREDLPVYREGLGILPDNLFFDSTLPLLEQQKSPRFSYFITMTSHGPYNGLYYMPKEREQLNIGNDSELSNYLTEIRFVDKSVGNFVRKVQERFKNHLIIVYGDHPPYLPSLGLKGNERVPLFILSDSAPRAGVVDRPGTQTDIPVMILKLLRLEIPTPWQGNDLLGNDR